MSCGIYKITNQINGKVYIGQSIAIEKRFTKHRNEGFNPNSKSYELPLYKGIRKYGLENFTFEILELCSPNELSSREMFFIEKFKSFEKSHGYNICIGEITPIKLTPTFVREIQKLLIESTKTQEEISQEYKIDQSMVSLINTGSAWFDELLVYPLRGKIERRCRCGEKISKGNKSGYCVACSKKQSRLVERPSKESLEKELIEGSFTKVGRKYGVSDNAIRRWCTAYGLPTTAKYYKEKAKSK